MDGGQDSAEAGPERPAEAMRSYQMPTLQGAPVAGIGLTEKITCVTSGDAGRYTAGTEFGRGGMGRILLVHDTCLSRDVALKELIPRVSDSGDTQLAAASPAESTHLVERFLREARITGNLEHPSIVPVYELGRRGDGTHYYTMKLVRGRTLQRAIRDARTLEERMALLPHVIDLCHAIAYAHSKGVIHRDIKPANVMVGSYGETVVIDWGLARVLNQDDPYAIDLSHVLDFTGADESGRDAAHTLPGIPVGTPHYMPPEQAEGRLDQVGTHSDIYALGVVLYEVLTGKTPYSGVRTRDVIRQVRNSRPLPATAHEPAIPPALAGICARAMERRPGDRYGSAAELAEELNRFSTGALVRAYEYNFWELLRHHYRKHRALCNTVLAAAMLIVAVVAISYAYILDANHKERIQRQAAEAEAYRANIQLAANDVKNESFQTARERLLAQPAAQRNWEWGILFEQCHQDVATGEVHQSAALRLIAAPGTKRLVSVGQEGEVLVWSAPYLEPLHRFDLPPLPGLAVAISPDEQTLVMARMDGVVELYDFGDYARIHTFKKEADSFNSLVFSGDGQRFAAGANDGTLFVWNRGDGSEVRRFQGHAGPAYVFGLNKDGTQLLSADDQGHGILWDLASGTPRLNVSGELPAVDARGERFALRNGATIRVWAMDTGAHLADVQTGSDVPGAIALSPGGAYLAARDSADAIGVWDLASGARVQRFEGTTVLGMLGFSENGEQLALAVHPNSAEIRNISDGDLVRRLQGHSNRVRDAVFDGANEIVFTCAGDTEVKAWRIPPVQPEDPDEANRRVTDLAWSEPAGLLAAGTLDGSVHFLRESDLSPVLTISSFEFNLGTLVAFNPDGDRAAITLGAKTAFIVTVPEGDVVRQWTGQSGRITAIAFSPDGSAVASASADATVQVWGEDPGMAPVVFSGHRAPVTTVQFLPDNACIVSGDESGNLLVWQWRSGKIEHAIETGSGVTALDASPDGTLLACGLDDQSIRMMRLDGEAPPIDMLGHDALAINMDFCNDNRRLLTLSRRGEVKIWDTTSGQELLSIGGSNSVTSSLAIGKDTVFRGSPRTGLEQISSYPQPLFKDSDFSKENLSIYKRKRQRANTDFQLDSVTNKILTPIEVLRRDFERIASLPLTDHVPKEPSKRDRFTWPLAALGIQPGDVVREVDGVMCRDVDDAITQIGEKLKGNDYVSNGLHIQLTRNELNVVLHHQAIELKSYDSKNTITRDDALALLTGLSERLTAYASFFLEYSQNRSRLSSGESPSLTTLDGLWIPPAASGEDLETLRRFGLAEDDHIVALNGDPITEYADLVGAVDKAIEALEAGHTGSATLMVERDRFQQLELVVSID